MTVINPFLYKAQVVRRRAEESDHLKVRTLLMLGGFALPLLAFLTADARSALWGLFGVWLVAVSIWAAMASLGVYVRERDLGTLELASLTPVAPFREVWGRFLGAFMPIAQGWMVGVSWPLAIALYSGSLGGVATMWLLALPWFAGWTALGLLCSTTAPNTTSALRRVFGFFVVLSLGSVLLQAWLDLPWNASFFLLPLNPLGFVECARIVTGEWGRWGHPPSAVRDLMLPLTVLSWSLFPLILLRLTAATVRWQWHLHQRPVKTAPAGASHPPLTAEQIRIRREAQSNTPLSLLSKLAAVMLRPFDGNPFYWAYRSGFTRIYSTRDAAPGSAFAAAFALCAMFLATMAVVANGFSPLPEVASIVAGVLTFLIIPAFAIGTLEGVAYGRAAIASERDRSTWMLLVVSGIRPRTLLTGKFVAAFYALSGEWLIVMPFWIVLAVFHPLALLLALLQPLAIALGIMSGLHTVCSRTQKFVFAASMLLIVMVCALSGILPDALALAFPYCVFENALGNRPEVGIAGFGVIASAAALVMSVMWVQSEHAIKRMLTEVDKALA
ncbi:MAG: hypothetical protein EB084_24095 [Proteobacteria bacterium]|nr:hypothetical protein [Pseudomonadota bacterium]